MPVEVLTLADRSLAYQRQFGGSPGVIFLGGFASDMEGTKAVFLSQRCAEAGISFVRFDYRGCGKSQARLREAQSDRDPQKSSGDFTDGTIGAWLEDSLAVFDALTQGPQIVVGSSMGGWLGLLLARARAERVRAFIGVAAAPDFTEDLVWEKLTAAQRETLLRDGEIYEDDAPEDHRGSRGCERRDEGGVHRAVAPNNKVPMTLKLIEEARNHLILRAPLALSCPIRLIQGMKDDEVPFAYAQRIAEHAAQEDARVTLIKNGDHRLSKPKDLDLLWRTVAEFI